MVKLVCRIQTSNFEYIRVRRTNANRAAMFVVLTVKLQVTDWNVNPLQGMSGEGGGGSKELIINIMKNWRNMNQSKSQNKKFDKNFTRSDK